ncbi:nickel/cobalt transporter [Pelagovum pacificum]|uniref:Nickel/cobalt efflux system n=1 Tax=Pelagovum pacificum TaxID=2588711 RepID=A0A5C5GF96_9RHOB|nr:hypothetical protein [Pelagovum pacificum]TNY32619.1 hypothetical protein FHY64_04885 [Pelagovum pacificum]
MRVRLLLLIVVAIVLAVALRGTLQDVAEWAVLMQRGFQNEIAGAIRELRAGEAGAWLALLAGAGAYGFVHAVGPGHGKYLVGGVGLGSDVGAARLLAIALVSSLAQALWAILLVYGGFALLQVSAQRLTSLTEDYLAPASYLAIAAIGLVLVGRGLLALRSGAVATRHGHHHHDHDHDAHCGHSHGPSPEDVAGLRSLRDMLILVVSIAIRPCTGAIFLLVIAWQMDIRLAGAIAVLVMGLGTSLLTSLVAVSSVVARGLAFASQGAERLGALSSSLQVFGGILIVWLSATMLFYSLA